MFFNNLLLLLTVVVLQIQGLIVHNYPSIQACNEPVVVLHGLLGSSRNFRTWVNNIKDSFCSFNSQREVICCDLRGHGTNVGLGQSISYTEMAEDIFDTMNSMGLQGVHLVGHSMGGKVAAAAALLRERASHLQIRSVSMLDISPVGYSEVEFESVIQSVKSLKAIDEAYINHQNPTQLMNHIGGEFLDVGMQQFVRSSCTTKDGNLEWNFDIPRIHDSLEHIADFPFAIEDKLLDVQSYVSDAKNWKPFEGPVLVLKGSESCFVQSKHHTQTSALFPNHRITSIQGAGHWMHIDAPKESARRVAEFIHASSISSLTDQKALSSLSNNFP